MLSVRQKYSRSLKMVEVVMFVQWERDSNSCMKHAYEGEYLGLKAVQKVGHFNNLSQLDS